jgi:hypothetical protein
MALKHENVFDVRMADRHLGMGKLTLEQLQAHLDALPDLADKAMPSSVQFVHGVRSRDLTDTYTDIDDE